MLLACPTSLHPFVGTAGMLLLCVLFFGFRALLRGYSVSTLYTTVTYKEWRRNTFKKPVRLYLELGYPSYVHIPTQQNWYREVPDWAKDRKREIIDRIVKELSQDKSIRFWQH